jgi:hypothetical protein
MASEQQVLQQNEQLRQQIEWMVQNQSYQKQRVEVSKQRAPMSQLVLKLFETRNNYRLLFFIELFDEFPFFQNHLFFSCF